MSRSVAIVLAAGSGSRMGSEVPKQYLLLKEKPVLYYSLETFQSCEEVDEILVVADPSHKDKIINYGFDKISNIIPGGKERYDSVYQGLLALRQNAPDYVLIHDGARPFADRELILKTLAGAKEYGAAAAAVPVTDTIRVSDEKGFGAETPDRRTLFSMQTPQTFAYELILEAYQWLLTHPDQLPVTDDAEVLYKFSGKKTFLSEGSYRNRKITTPEDLAIAEVL